MPTDSVPINYVIPNIPEPSPRYSQYQIMLNDGRMLTATPGMFNSWTGRRFRYGEEWHGPMKSLDGKPYRGARACPCVICQEFVS